MSDDTRGSMNIRMQQDMWASFMTIVKWSIAGIVLVLILMAIFLT